MTAPAATTIGAVKQIASFERSATIVRHFSVRLVSPVLFANFARAHP
jgi:hypothetical protein